MTAEEHAQVQKVLDSAPPMPGRVLHMSDGLSVRDDPNRLVATAVSPAGLIFELTAPDGVSVDEHRKHLAKCEPPAGWLLVGGPLIVTPLLVTRRAGA